MAGLIASALAGGIAGAGAAAGTALGRMQETEEKKSFEMMRSELEMQRQTAIENLRFANQEKGAISAQLRGRDDFKWQRTGEGGAAAREAALADMTQKYDFDNDATRVDRAIEIAGRKKRVETDNEGVTLGVGQQRIVGGKVVADNNSGKYIDALTLRASRAGGGGGGADGTKMPAALKEQWDSTEKESLIVERGFSDIQKWYRESRQKHIADPALDDVSRAKALTALDAELRQQTDVYKERAGEIAINRTRLLVKAGQIKPDDVIGDVLDRVSSPEEIERSIEQAKRIDRGFGRQVEAGLKPRLEEFRSQRRDQGRKEDRGFDPTVKQDMGEAPPSRGMVSGNRTAPVGRAGQATAPSFDLNLGKPVTRPGQGGSLQLDPRTGEPR